MLQTIPQIEFEYILKCVGGRVVASPYARKLAREAGIDIAHASGSGPSGRIVAADVQQLISSGGGKPAMAYTPASTGGEVGIPPKYLCPIPF